ncbi:WbqC family protein [Chryseobacterium sp. SNU WT5]|uniref:WbqC family protein n=1 Tax=Chryseobacterium sp. SNU WT5 TaxID=2594269 RepID=UPI00117D46C9|nr:WbqC family protein [Chryseobacterium sp. SNU WT5]QDP86333.1 WbqC family protein [Chryseobacterium sp. SNU WT5]
MPTLLPVFYLPPISWFSVFLKEDNEIVFEQFETFPKQTFRNRTNIYGANGKLSLIIPIDHSGKRVINELQVSNRDKWRSLHWKSIKTAYQSSPYFDYYEDQLEEIFNFKENSLFQFNLHALKIIQKILKSEKEFTFTKEYIRKPEQLNYREHFSAKHKSPFEMPEYFQSFSEKYGFLEDLSIIDLICNKGPESMTYLKNVRPI